MHMVRFVRQSSMGLSASESLTPLYSISYDALGVLVRKEDLHHVLVNREPFGAEPAVLLPEKSAEIDRL